MYDGSLYKGGQDFFDIQHTLVENKIEMRIDIEKKEILKEKRAGEKHIHYAQSPSA